MLPTDRSVRPFLLGVTGGIGAGKSRACRILESCGAEVFYADEEAKRLLLRADARVDVIAAFGTDTYRLDDSIEASERVRDAFAARAALSSAPVLVKEAAILFESGGDAELDATLVVDAPVEVRIARTMARDGVDRAAVEARIARQMPDDERRAKADYVIVNDGAGGDFDADVRALYRRVLSRGAESTSRA